MKILVVTNSYPPHHVGGYELGCRDVVEKLRLRGHDVHVLTGTLGVEGAPGTDAAGVERILRVEAGGVRKGKWKECRKLAGVLEKFQPDAVYFWNIGGI
jgi:LmbE family N-acetylglucosaminyl deacetylase